MKKQWLLSLIIAGALIAVSFLGASWRSALAQTIPTSSGSATDSWEGNWGAYLPGSYSFDGGLVINKINRYYFEMYWSQAPGLFYFYFNLDQNMLDAWNSGNLHIYAYNYATDSWVQCTTLYNGNDNLPYGRVYSWNLLCSGIDPASTHWLVHLGP